MSSICFYFQVHQPYRVKKYRIFDIGNNHEYFHNHAYINTDNAKILHKVIAKCYLPANNLLLKLLNKHPGFKISFSLSGVFIKQLEQFAPEVITSFQNLVNTGRCEILAETFYHSLSSIYSQQEFQEQVKKHEEIINKHFQVKPKVFRNTELIYSNSIAKAVESMGYKGIITEGVDRLLAGRSPNQIYRAEGCNNIAVLLKNYQLSDDIAFRFSDKNWNHHPLTAPKFTNWIHGLEQHSEQGNPLINLFMDYETFGEHQWEHSGIFQFLEHLPQEFLNNPNNSFLTPSEAIDKFGLQESIEYHTIPNPQAITNTQPLLGKKQPQTIIQSPPTIKVKYTNPEPLLHNHLPILDAPEHISWADSERDLSAWRSNDMQHEALDKIYSLEHSIKNTGDDEILEDWRKLTTSDHFYYMCTKYWSDGDVHKYFSPYDSPYEAFIYYMNVVKDLEIRIKNLAL